MDIDSIKRGLLHTSVMLVSGIFVLGYGFGCSHRQSVTVLQRAPSAYLEARVERINTNATEPFLYRVMVQRRSDSLAAPEEPVEVLFGDHFSTSTRKDHPEVRWKSDTVLEIRFTSGRIKRYQNYVQLVFGDPQEISNWRIRTVEVRIVDEDGPPTLPEE